MQWLLEFLERQGAVIRDAFPSFAGVCLVAIVVLYFVFERLYKARLESRDAFITSLKERLDLQEKSTSQPQTTNEWLNSVLEHDRLELHTAVHVIDCNVSESLQGDAPYVIFNFFVRNGSVYAITIDPHMKGFITLNGDRKLTAEVTASRLPHNLKHVYGDRFQVRQELTANDVEEINALDSAQERSGYYDFGNLHITVNGTAPTSTALPARLQFKRVARRQAAGNEFELI